MDLLFFFFCLNEFFMVLVFASSASAVVLGLHGVLVFCFLVPMCNYAWTDVRENGYITYQI